MKLALDRVLIKAGLDVLLHTRVAAVARTADRIQSVTLAGMDGRRRIAVEVFVDATGDANLAMLAGLECASEMIAARGTGRMTTTREENLGPVVLALKFDVSDEILPDDDDTELGSTSYPYTKDIGLIRQTLAYSASKRGPRCILTPSSCTDDQRGRPIV
ncbi:MAG: FAD-dependent oxidoreductase [Litoreibacter sp.]